MPEGLAMKGAVMGGLMTRPTQLEAPTGVLVMGLAQEPGQVLVQEVFGVVQSCDKISHLPLPSALVKLTVDTLVTGSQTVK